MPKTIIFSLDYDRCVEVLFKELHNKMQELMKQKSPTAQLYMNLGLQISKATLDGFLSAKQNESKTPAELYVGSARQSHELNQSNQEANQNGSCFENFETLCQEKSWIFRKLLLADIENKKPAGSAMEDKSLRCSFNQDKIEILKNQLQDVAKNHPDPDDETHFYFLDDDGLILPGLETYFTGHAHEIQKNIHVHLVKFDWFKVACKEEKLTEIISILGKKERASSIELEKTRVLAPAVGSEPVAASLSIITTSSELSSSARQSYLENEESYVKEDEFEPPSNGSLIQLK